MVLGDPKNRGCLRMSYSPIIITDLDGTLVNIMDEVLACIYEVTDIPLTPEMCIQYEYHEAFYPHLRAHFATIEALNQFLIRNCWYNPQMLLAAKPYWDLWEALNQYSEAGGEIVILTSRPRKIYGIEDATKKWLHKWLPKINYDSHLIFAQYGKKAASFRELKEEQFDASTRHFIFIDDQPETLKEVEKLEQSKSNIEVDTEIYKPDRPWVRAWIKDFFGVNSRETARTQWNCDLNQIKMHARVIKEQKNAQL